MHNGMASFTFTASQARSIHQYKKLKIKVLKCNADILFNKQCLSKKIIPNYDVNNGIPSEKLVECTLTTLFLVGVMMAR
jgi:hypothetical protein